MGTARAARPTISGNAGCPARVCARVSGPLFGPFRGGAAGGGDTRGAEERGGARSEAELGWASARQRSLAAMVRAEGAGGSGEREGGAAGTLAAWRNS